MIYKLLIIIVTLIQMIYTIILMKINEAHRALPLPDEVADIYEKQRYQDFLSYKKDYQKPKIISMLLSFVLSLFLLFTPFFQVMEDLGQHAIYLTFFITMVVTSLIESVGSIAVDYYATFTIEEKYGKNKQTKKEFFKDELLGFFMTLLMVSLLMFPIIYICEHISQWTHNFAITYQQAFLFTLAIALALGVVFVVIMLLSYVMLHLQYRFTDLEDGPLKDDIIALMKDSKKKVKYIKVYNESSKSTSKNAFLLKMLWHKEFGIADNFLEENSQRELLAVLAHEVGHLKHKKTLLNYLQYASFVVLFALIVYLLPHGMMIGQWNAAIMKSFHLDITSYYLILMILTTFYTPVMFLIGVFSNYVSRTEEYEADRNAVASGYGKELIATFKQLSTDELIDVNPAPLTEALTYDHPGMYNRIKAIEQAMKEA